MRVAYFVNQYPAVSHTFIRRELEALESSGLQVDRFALYTRAQDLVDPRDLEELQRVFFLLRCHPWVFVRDTAHTLLRNPWRFLRALGTALRQGFGSKSGVLRHCVYLLEACVLLRELRRRAVQHVHAHFGTNGTDVIMLARLLGGPPYSFTVHGPEEFDDAPIISLREKIQHAAFVVAISSFGRSQLYRLCDHARWPDIHVVHCGVPAAYGEAAAQVAPSGHRLICVGRLCEQKGQLLLIEAAAQLRRRQIRFELVLVGDGPMRSELESLVRQHQLESHVTFAGWCTGEEVRQQLLAARALVLPSFAEGLPVVLMESLAVHRPVVTTYIAGIPELVDADCGWIVPAGSVSHLTEALEDVLRLPIDQIREMGRKGAERVRRQHDVQQEADRLAELFRATISSRTSEGARRLSRSNGLAD